jgi:hypothetical protein
MRSTTGGSFISDGVDAVLAISSWSFMVPLCLMLEDKSKDKLCGAVVCFFV